MVLVDRQPPPNHEGFNQGNVYNSFQNSFHEYVLRKEEQLEDVSVKEEPIEEDQRNATSFQMLIIKAEDIKIENEDIKPYDNNCSIKTLIIKEVDIKTEDKDMKPYDNNCPIKVGATDLHKSSCHKRERKKGQKLKNKRYNNLGLYPCHKCSYQGKNLRLFKRHIMSHFENKKIKCSQCPYSTNFNSYMVAHAMTHVNIRPFKCSKCDFASKLKSNLKKHEAHHSKNHEMRPYLMLKKCSKCDFSTIHKNVLAKHQADHISQFNCSTCSFVANSKKLLKTHEKSHSVANASTGLKQTVDNKNKNSSGSLEKWSHLKTRNLKCIECNYVASTIRNLERHKKIHLKKDNDSNCKKDNDNNYKKDNDSNCKEILRCNNCDFSSSTEPELRDHILTHFESVNDDTTNECSSHFKEITDGHNSLNSELKPFKCTESNRDYKFKSSLMRDSLSHIENSRNNSGSKKNVNKKVHVDKGSLKKLANSTNVENIVGIETNEVPKTSENSTMNKKELITHNTIDNINIDDSINDGQEEIVNSKRKIKPKMQTSSINIYLKKKGKISRTKPISGTNKLSKSKTSEPNCKNFKRSKCDYSCNLALKHQLSHSNLEIFKCHQCNYESKIKRNLKQHQLSHLTEKLFKCPHCPYTSNFTSQIKQHQTKKHNNLFKLSQGIRPDNTVIPILLLPNHQANNFFSPTPLSFSTS